MNTSVCHYRGLFRLNATLEILFLGFVSKSDVFKAVFICVKGIAAQLMVKFKTPRDELNGQMVPNKEPGERTWLSVDMRKIWTDPLDLMTSVCFVGLDAPSRNILSRYM